MQSALYKGRLRHRRFSPAPHAFEYDTCMTWLDLSELDDVFRGRWLWSARRPTLAWLSRKDLIGDPSVSVDEAVRDRVAQETGRRPTGPIRLLTQLRTFGHSFNPVSFYYCYTPDGKQVETVVADITNTPWSERHAYVLPASRAERRGDALRFRFSKTFHVSPFMPMDIGYDWLFPEPGSRIVVHMQNWQATEKIFDATLTLAREEITGASLARTLLRFPCPSLQVLAAIYWNAALLWMKGVPFHTHPAKRAEEPAT